MNKVQSVLNSLGAKYKTRALQNSPEYLKAVRNRNAAGAAKWLVTAAGALGGFHSGTDNARKVMLSMLSKSGKTPSEFADIMARKGLNVTRPDPMKFNIGTKQIKFQPLSRVEYVGGLLNGINEGAAHWAIGRLTQGLVTPKAKINSLATKALAKQINKDALVATGVLGTAGIGAHLLTNG